MDLNLTINFDQLKSLIHQCGMEEKVTLVRMLEKETFPFRLDQLLKSTKTDDLTLEEITPERPSQTAAFGLQREPIT